MELVERYLDLEGMKGIKGALQSEKVEQKDLRQQKAHLENNK
jgi:hypothetical protein